MQSEAAFAGDSDYTYFSQFGGPGSGPGQFVGPGQLNWVAVDPISHDILVEDAGNSRVQIFSADGTYLRQFGSEGSGNGQFEGIGGIAIDPVTHNIAVADGNQRVQIFNWSGTYISQFGTQGSGNGQFNGPGSVAIDPISRNIFVTDLNNHRVQIFSANGTYLGKFGSQGTGIGQFSYALYLGIDPATHNVLVGDELNSNVQIFNSNGTYLRQFGTYGTGDGQFRNAPGAIAVDAATLDVFVQDYANSRVQIFDASGNYLSQFGSAGTGDGEFYPTDGPTGLDIDQSTHRVVVLDRGDSRAEIFAPSSTPPPPTCGPTQVLLSIQPPQATVSQSILFSAQASITAPFTGTVSFLVDGTSAATCTANMNGLDASCTHALGLGMHTIVAQYSGDGRNPPGCSQPQAVTITTDGGQTPTNTTCTTVPDTLIQGQPFTVACGVGGRQHESTGSAGITGYLTISQGANVLGYTQLAQGNSAYTTILAEGSYDLTIGYSGDSGYDISTVDIPVSVQAPADDIFYGGFDIPPG